METSIKPTFNGLDEVVKSGLVNAALKEEYVKEINQKVAEANPDPATIDMLGWGWPMPVWPKPSSFSSKKNGGLKRTVLLLGQYVFDGEVRTGDVTSTPYNVILITIVAGICFLGILIPCLFVMGSGEQVNYVPCWVGYLSIGVPFAILAIVGASLENGASGWNANRCTLVQYAGLALRPFWVIEAYPALSRIVLTVNRFETTCNGIFGALLFSLVHSLLHTSSKASSRNTASWTSETLAVGDSAVSGSSVSWL